MPTDSLFTAPGGASEAAIRITVAALIGLAVGIERQWSGHATGPSARFAGMRTFLILGLTGGVTGVMAAAGQVAIATAFAAGAAAFVIAAFVVAMRRPDAELDATTEVAALGVLALALLAGFGVLRVAAGVGAVIVFALSQKEYLHALVTRVEAAELHAAARFAVMALVVLPILPGEGMAWLGGVSLREVWLLVLLFSAVNFVGYLAQRAVGADRGYGIAGLFGGIVSSTAVTLQFARRSREEVDHAVALARGTVAASAVVPIRLLVIAAAISPAVAREALPYLIPPAALGLAILGIGLWRSGAEGGGTESVSRSPLNVISSMTLAGLITLALAVVETIGPAARPGQMLGSAALLGLTNTDALIVSMSRFGANGAHALAAQAIAVGLVSNAVFKAVLCAVLGTPAFRLRAAAGLLTMAAVTGVGFLL